MKKTKKKYNNKINYFAPLCLFFASFIMCIGYAQINVPLDITGYLSADVQENVFIIDAVCKSGSCDNNKVNYFYQTLLESNIDLGSDGNSTVTYEITLYNNASIDYVYKETIYDENFYSNNNIVFNDTLNKGDIISANNGRLTFEITFSYSDKSNITDTSLKSYINFLFVPRNEVQIVSFLYNGNVTNEFLDLGVTSVTYSNNVISNGVVARCNNGAVPTYSNNVVSATGVVDGTVCGVFDTLKESMEGADSSVNNMLMISNHSASTSITTKSSQVLNLNLNGKTITSNLGSDSSYISNAATLKIYDSTSNGNFKTNYTLVNNTGNLTIDSGKYNRTNSSTTSGKIIKSTAGTVRINGGSYVSDGTHAIENAGSSNMYIKNATFNVSGIDANAITNNSTDKLLTVTNCTIKSSSGGITAGDFNPNRIYVSKCTINAPIADFATNGGFIHYTADTIFTDSTNTPLVYRSGVGSENVVKNYIKNAPEDWYYLKNTSGSRVKSTDGKDMMVGDAFYIKAYSNYVIDIPGGNLASKSNVQLYTLNNTNAQQFMFLASSSSGYYNIAPFYAPTLFFNIDGGTSASLAHGANIHLYTAGDRPHERFKFDYSNNNGYYELKSYYGTNIDVSGGASTATNGTNVWSYNDNSSTGQFWKFVRK